VYQVGRASFIQPKNFSASKPGAHQTDPPAASEETAAISPWMWNSGITFRQRSLWRQRQRAPMFCAEAATLDCSERHDLGPRRGAGGVQDQRTNGLIALVNISDEFCECVRHASLIFEMLEAPRLGERLGNPRGPQASM
jgi:hypothetical protein